MNTALSPSSLLFLANVNRAQERLSEANLQISSGRKVNVASDAPDQIDSLLQLRANQQHNSQIQSNLTIAKTDAQTADDTLSSTLTIMDRALQLAAQAANSTETADTRNSIAQEVEALQTQMVAASQTQVQGRYIFSGDADNSPSYALNLTPPPDPTAPPDTATLTGVTQLTTSAATRQTEDPAGGSFLTSKTAQEIFDTRNADGTPAADNVFAALNGLRFALLNNDQTAITNSITSLKQASTHLNDVQAFYGTVENRIQNATSFASRYSTQLQTELSGIQDADPAAAAMELTQANTQLQAAFEMEAKMPNSSLFNYLA